MPIIIVAASGASIVNPPIAQTLWYDGDDIDGDFSYNSAYTHNDPIVTWVDKGSLGADITQGTSSARPTFKEGEGVGGKDTVYFDGGDYLQHTSGITITQPLLIAAVWQTDVLATLQTPIQLSDSVVTAPKLFMTSSKFAIYAGSTINSAADDDNSWHSHIGTFNDASSEVVTDGNEVTGTAGANNGDNVIVGAASNLLQKITGRISDILVYDTPPSSSSINDYHVEKYGMFPQ